MQMRAYSESPRFIMRTNTVRTCAYLCNMYNMHTSNMYNMHPNYNPIQHIYHSSSEEQHALTLDLAILDTDTEITDIDCSNTLHSVDVAHETANFFQAPQFSLARKLHLAAHLVSHAQSSSHGEDLFFYSPSRPSLWGFRSTISMWTLILVFKAS